MTLDTARGMLLLQLRREHGGNQKTIAALAHMNISSVVRAEKGRPVSDKTLTALAKCYGRTLSELKAEAASLCSSEAASPRVHTEISQMQQRDEWIGLWAVTPPEARDSLLAHATELVRDVIRMAAAKKTEGQS